MKKIVKIVIILLIPYFLYAHELEMNIVNNNDNTLTISGMFNTGETAAGALLKLEAKNTKEILFQKRLPSSNSLRVTIPTIEYMIILNGGDDDIVKKEGIAPKGGFKKEHSQKKASRTNANIATSKAVTISIAIAFLLLFATIFISIKNTNKLLKEIEKIK
ncbi:hypothetical protein CPU12_03055 [Malaciobacter molluscorum LMG 25693]|uniref:Membrane protein n=1 Tax=Malaciobacter molluscorum LMG 25693 TaxID=870501 RepID=A0A2G1DK32_9BACT|nr:hypothetical protein [Malaciobacter molluscorum]AXX91399.1 putative membrane protein [Malaciobacter molluscorum LMG 25693]PHO18852.1 hypothetical protein CPU12_03055 [Malaciobacter molluscorum LMG 25693]